MAYMEFANEGEIDLNAFKLLGASSKRESTDKIGFFGSGLKYATALMLREGIDFKVYSGKQEVKFGLNKEKFSGIDFDVITINGEKTSLTTQAGPDWEPWFAIREIYSNTVDEGGAMELQEKITPEKGTTKIYIEMSEKLGDVTTNWQDYFSFKRPVLDQIDVSGRSYVRTYKMFEKRRVDYPVIFRRGIRVGEFKSKRSIFDYDFTDIQINESRVMKSNWMVQGSIGDALMFSENPTVIKKFIDSWRHQSQYIEFDNTTWEYTLDRSFFGGSIFDDEPPRFSQEWLNQLKPKRLVPTELTGFYGITAKTVALPNKMLRMLQQQFGDELNIAGVKGVNNYMITGDPNDEYKEVHATLEKAGFSFPFEQIKMGKFHDDDIHGQFDKEENMIILSENSAHWSRRSKTMLLLEELLHKKSGFGDNTREFQTFIMQELADKIEGQ